MISVVKTRLCACGNPVTAYGKGRDTRCKACNRQHQKEYRMTRPRNALLVQSRVRARKYKLEHNLELSDIVLPETCPVLGIPLFLSNTGKVTDNSPSIDRFDNSKGYIKGNVNVISFRANTIKQNATISELRAVADWMEKCYI